ncbi:unnamed protein product [Malus baccata var. baccata]
MQVISVMYVAHLGEATSFASIGMGSALDTFCGQSYGAKQYHMLGIHLQKAMLVLGLVCQDPEIAAAAGNYACFLIPCLLAHAIQQCTATLLHLFLCWFLVYKTSLGYIGAALANPISYWINALLLIVYVRVSPSCKHTWTGFSKEAFRGIPDFIKLSIPSAIWSFELMVLLSGILPNPKLETSVLSISLNTCSMVYMIPMAFNGAASTRVSNQLGDSQPQLANLAVRVALSIVVMEGFLIGAVLGVIRGSGQQKVGAYVNLGAYYLMGSLQGLWTGIIVALFVEALCLSIIIICTDWEKEVKNASDRVYNTMTSANMS